MLGLVLDLVSWEIDNLFGVSEFTFTKRGLIFFFGSYDFSGPFYWRLFAVLIVAMLFGCFDVCGVEFTEAGE